MNQNNSEVNSAIFGIALVLTVLYFIFAVVAVLLGMACFVLTCLAIVAWINGGMTIGNDYLSPDEARNFILRGIGFAILVPIFWALLMAFIGEQNSASLEWLMLSGYVFGSAGIEILNAMEESEKQESNSQIILPPLPEPDHELPPVVPPMQPRKPFGYASWDDEELNR